MRRYVALALLLLLFACTDDAGDGGSNVEPGNDAGGDTSDVADVGAEETGDTNETDALADVPADGETPDVDDAGEDTPDVIADGDATPDADPDTGADADADTPEPAGVPSAEITQPAGRDVIEVGTPIDFRGVVGDTLHAPGMLAVRWVSDVDGPLFDGPPNRDGLTGFTTDALTPGWHNITLIATNPDGAVANAQVRIGICQWGDPETFDTEINGAAWRIYGDAFWDPGGWLEMTGNVQGRKGAIYNIRDIVNPGDVAIRFRIWTGGGTGADGFAMSVFDVADVAELDRLNAEAGSGGALGYGVGGDWGDWEVDGFHVEFDTWHNVFNGDNELHTDPTPENHIGVMTNGDPGTHHLWAEIPTIEDQQWHDVTVEVEGARVVVTLDGVTVIDGEVPGLNFKGGFIGFSGTTGFFTNFHRFDRLQVLQECRVE